MKKSLLILSTSLIIALSSTANADFFWKSGKIKNVMSGQYYAGCMIAFDSAIGNNCRGNWVSLDCKGLFNDKNKETGKKKFALAVAAAQTGKRVMVLVNNLHKANGFCVARQLRVYY